MSACFCAGGFYILSQCVSRERGWMWRFGRLHALLAVRRIPFPVVLCFCTRGTACSLNALVTMCIFLQLCTYGLSPVQDEVEKAKAQIAVDTYTAMAEALSLK
jgi:hypothetical protein